MQMHPLRAHVEKQIEIANTTNQNIINTDNMPSQGLSKNKIISTSGQTDNLFVWACCPCCLAHETEVMDSDLGKKNKISCCNSCCSSCLECMSECCSTFCPCFSCGWCENWNCCKELQGFLLL